MSMKDRELYIREHIERKELRAIRNKNIVKAILVLIVLFIIFINVNKAYERYKEKVYDDKMQIMSSNKRIIWEFTDGLQFVNDTIIDLIFEREIERDLVRGMIIEKSSHIRKYTSFRYDHEKYNINALNTTLFFTNSINTICGILQQDSISEEEKEFLAGIYKVNQDIINTYRKHEERIETSENSEEIRYSLYYEGEMLYHLVNTIHASSDGVKTYIEKKDSRPREDSSSEREDASDEMINQLQRIISDDKALSLANKMYSVIFDNKAAKLEVSGYTSINYNAGTYDMQYLEDKSGKYLDSIEYSAENTEGCITVHVRDHYNQVSYTNYDYSPKKEIPEAEIDKRAEEIINRLDCELLKLERKSENIMGLEDVDAISYLYSIKDESYYDESTEIYLSIYKDGTVRELDIGNFALLDGIYQKITPVISPQEAIIALDIYSQHGVKSVVLVNSYEPYYEIDFNRLGIDFRAHVNAQKGELMKIFGSYEY